MSPWQDEYTRKTHQSAYLCQVKSTVIYFLQHLLDKTSILHMVYMDHMQSMKTSRVQCIVLEIQYDCHLPIFSRNNPKI